MLIEKYLFCLPKANEVQRRKLNLARGLTNNELYIMYAIKRLPQATKSSLYRYGSMWGAISNRVTIFRALKFLIKAGLVNEDNGKFNLTFQGREYIFGIRRYLLNIRLT